MGEAERQGFKLPAFTLLSGIGWCIDFAIFNFLIALGQTYFVSNLISAAIAVSFVLITARRWVFRDHIGSLDAVVAKYVLWNVVAITVASLLIHLAAIGLEQFDIRAISAAIARVTDYVPDKTAIVSNLSKLLITLITMYANFIAVGYIVERRFSFY